VAIVGAGKVGQVLGRILADNGATITCVISRTPGSVAAGKRFLRCRIGSTSLAAIPRETNLVFIATPHAAVSGVAAALAAEAPLRWTSTFVCHASGMLTAEALAPLRRKGAGVFSFHPLQTFPRDFAPHEIVPIARGIWYGVDGDGAAIRRARSLARSLEGRVMVVPPELRVFYHAACVVASNHLTALLADLETMGARFDPRHALDAFRPIIDATLNNVFRTSPARALSGPVARGGVETVREHLLSVRRTIPELIPYFVSMTGETVRLARTKGALPDEKLAAFDAMLGAFSRIPGPEGGIE